MTQEDPRPRLFEPEPEKPRDRLAEDKRELESTQKKLATAEHEVDRLRAEVAELEARIAAVVALRTGKPAPEAAATKEQRVTMPKRQTKAPKSKRQLDHKPRDWMPAEIMRIFDALQPIEDFYEREERMLALSKEYKCSPNAVRNQWKDEQKRRGLR